MVLLSHKLLKKCCFLKYRARLLYIFLVFSFTCKNTLEKLVNSTRYSSYSNDFLNYLLLFWYIIVDILLLVLQYLNTNVKVRSQIFNFKIDSFSLSIYSKLFSKMINYCCTLFHHKFHSMHFAKLISVHLSTCTARGKSLAPRLATRKNL